MYFTKKDDKFVMVSTDARRLSYAEKPLPSGINFESAIVPTKILKCILKKSRKIMDKFGSTFSSFLVFYTLSMRVAHDFL